MPELFSLGPPSNMRDDDRTVPVEGRGRAEIRSRGKGDIGQTQRGLGRNQPATTLRDWGSPTSMQDLAGGWAKVSAKVVRKLIIIL